MFTQHFDRNGCSVVGIDVACHKGSSKRPSRSTHKLGICQIKVSIQKRRDARLPVEEFTASWEVDDELTMATAAAAAAAAAARAAPGAGEGQGGGDGGDGHGEATS
jgi:hypothetical protein